MRFLLSVVVLAALVGCNEVSQGYRPVVNYQALQTNKLVEFASGEPEIREGKAPETDIPELRRQGWYMLGYSVFPDNPTLQQQLHDKGVELKASLVVFTVLASRQQSGMTAVPTSTGTLFLPMNSISREYGASFWIREKPTAMGLYGRNLTQEEAIKRGDGNGMLVAVLAVQCTAYRAGLREGDIVTRIAGKEVINAADAFRTLRATRINPTDFYVLRDGQPMTFSVENNADVAE